MSTTVITNNQNLLFGIAQSRHIFVYWSQSFSVCKQIPLSPPPDLSQCQKAKARANARPCISKAKPKGRDNKNQGQGQCPRQGACPGQSPAPIALCVFDFDCCNKFPKRWQWMELHPARPAHGPVGCTNGQWPLAIIGGKRP